MPVLNTSRREPITALLYQILPALGLSAFMLILVSFLLLGGASCEGDGCALLSPALLFPVVTVVVGIILAYPILYWTLFSYELKEHSITVNSGILFRQYETIDFGRIQTVDNERGPLLWLFGLTMVKVWTASADQFSFTLEKNSMKSQPRPDTILVLNSDAAQTLKDFMMSARSHTSTL